MAGGAVSLGPASAADRALCWRLQRDAMRPYVEATWGWDEADQQRRFEDAFEPASLQLIELDGEAVGLLKVDYDATPVRLLNLQVAPPHQNRGIGTAVVAHVLRRAGARPTWLQVLRVNPARALYERLGFRVIGETATHWRMLHTPAD